VSKLTKLEHLTMKRNQVERISAQLRNMSALRTLNLRYNNLTHTSIPPEIFENEELTTLGKEISTVLCF
jgi:Leucine-rich repeat (LRR) protein